ncbi:MAG: efflux transporter outer membrane subunit [Gammaproteobacteria bacterium]|nr:efflux transporter outer membrane subunit [Gammaproteobacteria bacterium]
MTARLSSFIKNYLFGATLALSLLLQGCISPPADSPTALPAAGSFSLDKSVTAALASSEFTRGDWPQDNWWRVFNDSQLDALIEQALAENPDIKIAGARVQLAQQLAAAVHAGNFPQLDANASVTREHFSENWIVPPPFAGQSQNEGQVAFNAAYDLDLWDRNAELYKAKLGEAKAAQAAQAETRLVVSTSLAGAYFQLQGHIARLDIALTALDQRQALATLTQRRADTGLETLVAVKQTSADVAREAANVVALKRAVAADKRFIAALLGKGPDAAESIASPVSHFEGTFHVPEILPMDMLARRPDVTVQGWRVESAAHEIGVAKAGFYPNINIAAVIGLQSLEIKNLLTAGSQFTSYGAAIHLPIFGGGRLRANLGAAYAEYNIAVEQYRRVLIDAAREVADQLAAVRSVAEEQAHQSQALQDSEAAYRIARLRYEQGITDYLTVLQVERDVLRQRDANAQLAETRLQSLLGLIKTLGGGYRTQDIPVRPKTAQEQTNHG